MLGFGKGSKQASKHLRREMDHMEQEWINSVSGNTWIVI
jgi:hypothetical protein